jgi:hypothetical protein
MVESFENFQLRTYIVDVFSQQIYFNFGYKKNFSYLKAWNVFIFFHIVEIEMLDFKNSIRQLIQHRIANYDMSTVNLMRN